MLFFWFSAKTIMEEPISSVCPIQRASDVLLSRAGSCATQREDAAADTNVVVDGTWIELSLINQLDAFPPTNMIEVNACQLRLS